MKLEQFPTVPSCRKALAPGAFGDASLSLLTGVFSGVHWSPEDRKPATEEGRQGQPAGTPQTAVPPLHR